MEEIPLDLLAPNPIREATKTDEDFLASIREGVIRPLVVRPVGSDARGSRCRVRLIV